jgi:hypothetical protein
VSDGGNDGATMSCVLSSPNVVEIFGQQMAIFPGLGGGCIGWPEVPAQRGVGPWLRMMAVFWAPNVDFSRDEGSGGLRLPQRDTKGAERWWVEGRCTARAVHNDILERQCNWRPNIVWVQTLSAAVDMSGLGYESLLENFVGPERSRSRGRSLVQDLATPLKS